MQSISFVIGFPSLVPKSECSRDATQNKEPLMPTPLPAVPGKSWVYTEWSNILSCGRLLEVIQLNLTECDCSVEVTIL